MTSTFIIIIINFQLLAMPSGKCAQWEPTGGVSSNLAIWAKTWQTDIHFIIIYISPAWQGEGKISKNVTNTQTLHHYIYIASLAGGRQNKQKRDRQTYTSSLYICHHHYHRHHHHAHWFSSTPSSPKTSSHSLSKLPSKSLLSSLLNQDPYWYY